MSASALLSALDGVRKTGDGRYLARCPAHGDKRASLVVTEKEDGRVLMHCFAGCSVHEVLAATGCTMESLFPKSEYTGKKERRPFVAMDVLRAISFEAQVLTLIAAHMKAGKPLSEQSYARLVTCAERVNDAERIAHGA